MEIIAHELRLVYTRPVSTSLFFFDNELTNEGAVEHVRGEIMLRKFWIGFRGGGQAHLGTWSREEYGPGTTRSIMALWHTGKKVFEASSGKAGVGQG